MGKGQAWSMDLVVGVLIFLIAVGVIYSLLGNFNSNRNPERLSIESEVVANIIVDEPTLRVAPNNQLDMDQLLSLASDSDYAALKKELGIQHEFCIFLQDEEGNLIYIQNGTEKYVGIGSNTTDFMLTGERIPCGESCDGYDCGS